jgi:DNA mismatch endonuclease (patch repair protein)
LRIALVRGKLSGWRVQARDIAGSPDIIFEQERLTIFLDGCFWHGCARCYRRPKSSQRYWDAKVKRNIARDQRVNARLRRAGWSVMRIKEHSLTNLDHVVARIQTRLGKSND